MFKRSDKKSSSKKQAFAKLLVTSNIKELLEFDNTELLQSFNLTDEMLNRLKDYLIEICTEVDFRIKFGQELQTTNKRSKQLEETKKIVFSLREADRTSDKALDFLKEKLDLLVNEQENFAMKLLTFQEKLPQIPSYELEQQVEIFVNSITFLETESWENDLDYYRTRFLMQREQEKDDQLKQEFVPEDFTAKYDPLAKPKVESLQKITKPFILLNLTKKQSQEINQLINDYNRLIEQIPDEYLNYILETPINELKIKFPDQEKISFETGKEMYALKREQGILTLKTYEIVQTLRSRLLNITGALASRSFLKDGFRDLITFVNNKSLTIDEKRLTLQKGINRLLRILGELEPGEGL